MSEDYQYPPRQVEPRPEKQFAPGNGRISGYLATFLGGASLLGVLCYLFPSYLTTTDLRAAYNADTLKMVLKYIMWFSLFFGVVTFLVNKRKRLGTLGIGLTLIAFALGGYQVQSGPVEALPLSLGIDWMVLAFLASTVIFITLEKLFPKYREQVILRPEWGLDFGYFCLNHLLISTILLVGNYFSSSLDWAANATLQGWLQSLPVWIQAIILVLFADFVLSWSHRAFHEIPWLWKIHAVHHSTETLDWLAGSRGHFLQIFTERSLVMATLYLLGADKTALDIYVTIAALQAVIIHANLGISFGPLKYLIVTPRYHHWHHSSQKPAIDTNYTAHSPLFDRLFGTYHMPTEHWPADYGTTKRLPRTFWSQLMYPFMRSKQPVTSEL